MKTPYKIIIIIIYAISGFFVSVFVSQDSVGQYFVLPSFIFWFIVPITIGLVYNQFIKKNYSKKPSITRFVVVMIFLSIVMIAPSYVFLNEVQFQITSTDEEKRSREIHDKLEISKTSEREKWKRSEELKIKNSDITFPITNNVYKTLSKEELRDKIYSNLVKYQGKDGVGDSLHKILANVLKRSCGISERDMKRVDGNFDYSYKYEIKEIDNTKYAEIVFFIKFKPNNDEFGDFTDEGLCVALTNFKFITNLETGEIGRSYGDKNAKIVQDILK